MAHNLEHVLPVSARVAPSGRLEIGGCDTAGLAEDFGTPLFVFCEETFRARARAFREAFPDSTAYYAAKAFLSKGMCRLVESEDLGLDVASEGELHVALAAGFPPERMIMHGNNKSDAYLRRGVEAGVGRVAVDNREEVDRLAQVAGELGTRQAVLLRVNPGVEAHTHHYIQTAQEDSKFGVSIHGGLAMDVAGQAADRGSLDLVGVHAHIGSNIFSYDPFGKTVEILFDFLALVETTMGVSLHEVNLGGGIGIPYVAGDYPARLDLLAALLKETAEREAARHEIHLPDLAFEPGRYLVGNAMLTLYSVGVVKDVPGFRTYVSVDGGMSDNIRPALYQARYSAVVATRAAEEPTKLVTIAGMHCESGDILVHDVAVPPGVSRGDLIAVPATGAYCYSMASNYNKQPRPAIVSVQGGKARLLVRRESYDDLLRLDEES